MIFKLRKMNFNTKALTKAAGMCPVLVIVALLVWVYYAYVFVYLRSIMTTSTASAVIFLLLFHCFYILQTYTYYKVIVTHPGSPPRSLLSAYHGRNDVAGGVEVGVGGSHGPDRELVDPEVYSYDQMTMVTAKRNGEPRMCRKCDNLKPDRTHHCSICGECILKFDHHCPWINNCVGFGNQKFFILFLLYSALLGGYVFASIFLYYATDSSGFYGTQIAIVLVAIIGVVFCFALLLFTAMHIAFVLYNKTTIESFERHRYRNIQHGSSTYRGTRRDYVNVFDMGKYNNWCQVMGDDKWRWFLPVGNSIGNGLEFPYNQDAYQSLVELQTELVS